MSRLSSDQQERLKQKGWICIYENPYLRIEHWRKGHDQVEVNLEEKEPIVMPERSMVHWHDALRFHVDAGIPIPNVEFTINKEDTTHATPQDRT